jgi:hypothetical protein
MRVGVDFLRERRSVGKPINTDFFQALLSPYILCKRVSARPRFSRAPADVPLIGLQSMPQFLQTALGTTAHRCLFTVSLCSSVIGRPWHAALLVLSLASELSPPPMWPCNPQLLKYVSPY